MIDSTFIGLLETQIGELTAASPEQQNKILLQIAKLAIAQTDTAPEVMTEYDKFEMRLIFSAFADIGVNVRDFFESSKEYLDPAALKGKIGTKLSDTTAAISKVDADLKELNESEAQLLSKEPLLISLQEQFDALKSKIDRLKTIQAAAAPEIIENLKKEIEYLEPEIERCRLEKDKLEIVLNELRSKAETGANDLSVVEDSIASTIEAHEQLLSATVFKSNRSLVEAKQRIEEYRAQYKGIEVTLDVHAEELSFWEIQLGENSAIVEAMKRYGTKSVAELLDDIERIKGTIADDLKTYDLLLKQIIEHEEGIRKAVADRQNKR